MQTNLPNILVAATLVIARPLCSSPVLALVYGLVRRTSRLLRDGPTLVA
jgi:hypothetical protein